MLTRPMIKEKELFHLMREYLKYISDDDTISYATYILANYCMPTLLKAKPSNVVNVNKKYVEDEMKFYQIISNEIEQFGSSCSILYDNEVMCLLLIYNNELLHQVLVQNENEFVLKSYGYEFHNNLVENSIERLRERYKVYRNEGMDFPHELGIILGYPLKDVKDFIKNNGRNYIFCGVWKVYNDVDKAEKTFEVFRMLREDAMRIVLSGKRLNEIKTYYNYGAKLMNSY